MDCCFVFWDLRRAALANFVCWLTLEGNFDLKRSNAFRRITSWSFAKRKLSLNFKICASSKLSLHVWDTDGNARNIWVWCRSIRNVLASLKALSAVSKSKQLQLTQFWKTFWSSWAAVLYGLLWVIGTNRPILVTYLIALFGFLSVEYTWPCLDC